MPVYFLTEGTRGIAVWRASDDATDVYLCGVDLQAYGDPRVCEAFAALVSAVADYHRRTHVAGAADPTAWIAELPCSDCSAPEAADVLHRARQAASASELGLTGGGYVAGCCKSRIVGVVMSGGSDSPRPAARR
jgi:hypothetical protein